MINIALIKYSFENLRKRKLRSFLTILSVLIGITSITVLISFGYGISSYVSEISNKMGNDKLIVQAKGFSFTGPSMDSNVILSDSDLKKIREVNGVSEATGVYMMSAEVEFDKKKKYAFMMGSDYKNHKAIISEVYALTQLEGSELKDETDKAILGYSYKIKDKIFKQPVKLRDTININGKEVKVSGFYEEVGNPVDDSHVYMTKEAFEDVFNATNYQFIVIRSSPSENPTKLAEIVQEKLRNHRNQKEGKEDFFVQTFEQVIETFNSILNVITIVVILIAFISLIVAAVNITNTMYASILERTKEIGVFKAIGAKNKSILLIFILESGLLSLIGGILGILLGYILSKFAGNLISKAGYAVFSPLFTWHLVVGSLLFAFLIGIFAGLFPAYRASKLKPIDALRYE